jgi:putative hemolysin
MESERGLMIFPSGRLSRRRGGVLTDPPWAGSAFSVARKYEAPIVPMHLTGPWSTLFHLFDRFSGELRDITLFHELLNKRGKVFTLVIGRPVMPGAIASDPVVAAEAMKHFVERTRPASADAEFDGGQL